MHVYINYSLVLIFLHGKKVYWGREKKMRNIYREKDRKRRKKRKKQGPACLCRRSVGKRAGVLGACYNQKAFKTIQENSWDT